MIPLPKLDGRSAELLRQVGAGRSIASERGTLSLAYRQTAGGSLTLTGTVGDAPVQLCVDAAQWCRWVEPVLAVADWSQVPRDLQAPLAAWTFDTLGNTLDPLGGEGSPVVWPSAAGLECATVGRRFGWQLTCICGERQLDALVLDAPLDWLETLAQALPPVAGDAAAPIGVHVRLVAGWSSVPGETVEHLGVGDALVLRRACRVEQHEFALFTLTPIARIRRCDAGTYSIEERMNELDDWLDFEPAAPGGQDGAEARTPLVRIVAELGSFELSAPELAALRPGDVLTGPARIDELVTLKIGQRVIARATLIDIDGQLAARIETL